MTQRRTLTLDDDVAARLEAEAERKGVDSTELANEALRRVLEDEKPLETQPFVIEARDLRLRPGLQIDKIENLLDEIEGPWRR